jgi:hypothetical protein
MVKRLLLFCFLLCSGAQLSAQIYGNEWVNYSQRHYRIAIPKTGLYRIDSLTLSNAGIPISAINPKNIQLFSKGQELYLYINGESDGVLNTTDYIEFYSEKNDGRFDSLAYNTTQRLPNPYVALFNDTNYVYFTWNSSVTNKRMSLQTDVNFTGYTAADYVYNEKVFAGTANYSLGANLISGSVYTDPRYVECEGYGSTIPQGGTLQTYFGNLNVFGSSALPAYLKTSYSGDSQDFSTSSYDHNVKFEYYDNSNNYTTLNDTTFFGYKQIYVERQIPSNLLQNSSLLRVSSVNSPFFSGFTNSTNLHYMYLKYPQIPDLAGQSEQVFFVDDNSSAAKTFLDLQNVNVGSGSVILYDLSTHNYFSTAVSGNNVKALIPNSGTQKKCFITNSTNVNNVSKLTPVNQTGFFVDYTSMITDSAFLIVSHKGLQSSANAYKTYRQSLAGGSNQVILGFIDELYDQFAYGNQKNPLAIKNFCKFLSDNLPKPPKYLLLIGKSVKNDFVRLSPTYWNLNDLPTMGVPASDYLFTTGIQGANSATPFIPTGRVSAKTDQQATWYLDKVMAHESSLNTISTEQDDWHKRVLHFAGGAGIVQQTQFTNYLNAYANTIKDTLFGGRVFTFTKNSTAPIQITVSDSVKELIDYGASIITFFGHASVTGFDQAIDDPTVYHNTGKYPLFIANSCYSGDIHEPQQISTSENFTLIDQKGSIGFIASTSEGLTSTLDFFTSQLYHALAYNLYYKGIGDAVKNSCYQNSLSNSQLQDVTCLEMTLEGDPSIKLNAYSKPDYEIKNTSVSFNTTNYVDSIGISIRIRNLGKAIKDTFIVRVERYFASGDSIVFLRKIKAPYNCDTLHFFINKDFENGIGLNHFKVYIDAFNKISETFENNNSTNGYVDLFISGGDVVPVYPYKYAIIPNTPTVTLKASTSDPFYASANYKIQLDTNDTFINPINSITVNSIGGIIEWTVNLPFADSTVYFWRITRDSTVITDHLNWRESSFQVIGTKTGWAQAHFHQFKNDNYQFVKYKKPFRKFVFENDIKSLECNDGRYGYVNFDGINYKVNNSLEDYWSCSPGGGWSFAVFDSISAKAWETTTATTYTAPGNFNNCVCYAPPLKSVSFGVWNYCGFVGYNWQAAMETFLANIPPNNKVLAWSVENHFSSTFSNSLYQQFESFGASAIRTANDTFPYIIFGTKGTSIGSAHEVKGTAISSIIRLSDTLKTRWNNGYIASEIIGPSTKWRSLHWKQAPVELPNTDSIVLQVVGIRANGQRDTVTTFNSLTTDILNFDTYVDAAIYPNLQLIARMRDNVNLTPPQLKKWQVIYDEVPECAINPKKGYTATNDTMQEGANFIVHLPIENIGVLPFTDSLLVTYWLEDKDRIIHPLPQKLKMAPFVSAQVLIDTIQLSSYQYQGLNYLWVDVNPLSNPRYQLEQYHFNNIARIPFMVNSDKINPLLDVTFDGTHILNDDVISAKPHVLITLKDENKFLALNDTSNFAVYIKYPGQSSEKRLYFSNALQFTPAQLPSNSCKIEWKPEFAIDGKYALRVQATDRSRNVSGSVDYTIQFEVITKQTITEVLNYPNPFSTSTRFVFTLTGSEVPDIFTIQIMTITGKVVREINRNELGNVHIGRNITDYAWDGKDEYGDKLGNGVYLYRVITRSNGQVIEKNATDADSFFKKGVGKMVIMR